MSNQAGARCVVTGAAGLVGSHLADRLLATGATVIGIDCFTDYYDPAIKEVNLEDLRGRKASSWSPATSPPIPSRYGWKVLISYFTRQVSRVFVPAGALTSPDTRYTNVTATQRLLEACRGVRGQCRMVHASSSSIYGGAETMPTNEDALSMPVSPYGVTKLAAEHLCRVYARVFGVPAVTLRYFAVYGQRQRPHMAFTRFCRALSARDEIKIYGDGLQTRDFTYVDDIVTANLTAALAPADRVVGGTYNLGGGTRMTINDVLEVLFRVAGRRTQVCYGDVQPGDARHTAADTSRAPRPRLPAGGSGRSRPGSAVAMGGGRAYVKG